MHAHQVLARRQVSSRLPLGPGQLALPIAVRPEAAVGGQSRHGDAVQVLLTTNVGKPEARTMAVLSRATVDDDGYEQCVAVANTERAECPARNWCRTTHADGFRH